MTGYAPYDRAMIRIAAEKRERALRMALAILSKARKQSEDTMARGMLLRAWQHLRDSE